jgi:hypothetical protein
MAIMDRTKDARKRGPETKTNAGEKNSKTTPATRQKNDQIEGFQSFCRSAAGTLMTSTGTGRALGMSGEFSRVVGVRLSTISICLTE